MHAAVHGHVQQGRSNVDSDAVPDATLQSLLDSIMNGSLQAVHSTAAAMVHPVYISNQKALICTSCTNFLNKQHVMWLFSPKYTKYTIRPQATVADASPLSIGMLIPLKCAPISHFHRY